MKAVDTTTLTSLERAVYGTNLINKLTIQNLRKVLPQLETFKGKKICLANGNKSTNFKVELLSYTDNNGQVLRTFLHFSGNLVYLKQDVTVKEKSFEGGGYSVSYFENNIHVGTMTNGVLISVETMYQIEISYQLGKEFCAKKVKETREKIAELKTEISKLESSIYSFKNI
jgi:hypothetical protein